MNRIICGVLSTYFAFSFAAWADKSPPATITLPEVCSHTLTVGKQVFMLEVARSAGEKKKGLMSRPRLADNSAMIFVYDKEEHRPVWMKNVHMPLDIVWVDATGTVVDIVSEAPPCIAESKHCPTYGEKTTALYFIEFVAGTVTKTKLKLGDRLAWDFIVMSEGRWFFYPAIMERPIIIQLNNEGVD